jgi:hemolysin III
MNSKRKVNVPEIFNAVTHGVGAGLAIAALVILIVFSSAESFAGYVVFGIALTILYLTSTLYHSFTNEKVKTLFRKFDHMAIFILIAGTYTPYCLVTLKNSYGLALLVAIWALAISGIVLKIFLTGKLEWLSLSLYAIMGWLALIMIKSIYDALPHESFILLIAGGIAYTTGILFYSSERWKYNHSIWHLFVLAGSCCHFFSVLTLQ